MCNQSKAYTISTIQACINYFVSNKYKDHPHMHDMIDTYKYSKFLYKKVPSSYQSLVGLVVVDAELGMENYSSILRNCDREETETI
jgi:hypothetical protein